jgi:hypothetical protein
VVVKRSRRVSNYAQWLRFTESSGRWGCHGESAAPSPSLYMYKGLSVCSFLWLGLAACVLGLVFCTGREAGWGEGFVCL